jgi:serine-type D-Ala-D-Ala carboxypeptidase/endopeptidase (penicillin-binding protein 4)
MLNAWSSLTAVVLAVALIVPTSGTAAVDATLKKLPKQIEAYIARRGFSIDSVGVYLREVSADKPLLAVNAERGFNPASTMKLVVTYAGLNLLGPTYRWHTHAYTHGKLKDGHLAGDLYIKGEGDPFLITEYFWRFLRAVRDRGVQHIDGDLVLDTSHFDLPPGDPGAFDGRPYKAYNVLPETLLLNHKVTRFIFLPDPANSRVRIIVDPPSTTLKIDNKLKLVKGACKRGPGRITKRVTKTASGTTVRFGGKYPRGCGEHSWSRALSDMQPFIHGVFKSLWGELGGTLNGGVRLGVRPASAKRVHTDESRSLAELIRAINKYSNNVMTRQLLLSIGARKGGTPGTTEKGVKAVRDWLAQAGVDMPRLRMQNGAGLSRVARVSPQGMGRLLASAWHSRYMPEFISSLPLSGMEGTMRRRFKGEALEGRLHVKTGTLNDVRTLAGYILTRSNRRFALVIMLNHAGAHGRNGLLVQDSILRWLFER